MKKSNNRINTYNVGWRQVLARPSSTYWPGKESKHIKLQTHTLRIGINKKKLSRFGKLRYVNDLYGCEW